MNRDPLDSRHDVIFSTFDGEPGDFSPVEPRNTALPSGEVGPSSNTGQKGATHGAIIDYLTIVAPAGHLEDCHSLKSGRLELLLSMIFGGSALLSTSGWTGKGWNFYADSAVIFDRDGELVGRIGAGGNKETVCVSLTGAGCRWVKDWSYVQSRLEIIQAHISRCDVAYDDYDGELLNVHQMRDEARTGTGFTSNGRPPQSRFIDDHGSGKGCTLYVGAKGHKELCVYEKGKQFGDLTSTWTRAECRFYGKHIGGVPLDMLTRPLDFLRGAYPVLERILIGACDRLTTVVKTVEATATAMVSWLKKQCGPSIGLLMQALHQPDEFLAFAKEQVVRESRPGRFKRSGAGEHLSALIRNQLLCQPST